MRDKDALDLTVAALSLERGRRIQDARELPNIATTAAQRALVAKHGTPAMFAAAVWNALGEISVAEAEAAIAAFVREWADAGEP